MPENDEVILVTASYDRTIRFWDADKGTCSRVLTLNESTVVNCLALHPGKCLLAAGGFQNIQLYDIVSPNPSLIMSFEGITKNVTCIGFTETGEWMYTGGEDGYARIWDCKDVLKMKNLILTRTINVKYTINTMVLHPNQAEFFIGDQNGTITHWNLISDKIEEYVPAGNSSEHAIRSVDINNEANMFVAGNSSGCCFNWSLIGGFSSTLTKLIRKSKIAAHSRYILRCKFSPDSTLLATTSADKTAKVWRTADLTLIVCLKSGRWVWDCAFTFDSQYLLTISSDAMMRLWHIETGVAKREYPGHHSAITCLAFSDSPSN